MIQFLRMCSRIFVALMDGLMVLFGAMITQFPYAYFREEFEGLIDSLLLQVPIGGGIIGQAAYTNKHLWMSSEDHYSEHNFSGLIWDMFLDDYEFRSQFSSGMKTIAVIPVDQQGVVQFGSSEKILETMEFVNQTKRTFQEIINGGASETGLSSLTHQIYHQKGVLDCNSMEPSSSSALFDSFPDFNIPDEFFQIGDLDVSQWFPPLKDDFLPQELGFIPFNSDEKTESLTVSGTDAALGDILAPVINYSSECMSMSKSKSKSTQQVDYTTLGSKERLFSKLVIEELLEGDSGISNDGSTSCIEGGEVSVKRRKTGNCMWNKSSMEPKKEVMSGLTTDPQVKPLKPTKKKAKPGTRPRPKDRQQILDRMAELRQLIPNGDKMSIDCLLDRTIKHMLFLESVTKQAYKIKKADERKHNGAGSNDPSTNGVTWACELGNETMVCPLVIEDLGPPGQMLIEMLCEEHGFFLEIVDMIRCFGLIILKGVMEPRTNKIWARFIVEAKVNMHVTRHEIFSALVQFLQTTSPRDDKKCTKAGSSLLDDFLQSGFQNNVNFT